MISKMLVINKLLAINILICPLVNSCADSEKLNTDRRSIETNSSNKSNAQEKDNYVVSDPVMVGGAFLVCAEDITLENNGANSIVGCRLEDSNGNKLTATPVRQEELLLTLENEPIEVFLEDSDSFWHWRAEYKPELQTYYLAEYIGDHKDLNNTTTTILDEHPGRLKNIEFANDSGLKFHILFISSEMMGLGSQGGKDFDSLESADEICTNLGKTIVAGYEFKAILSDSFNSAQNRISIDRPVTLLNGKLFSSAKKFWSSKHKNNIIITEKSKDLDSNQPIIVWSGTTQEGLSDGKNCSDWASSSSLDEATTALPRSSSKNDWINHETNPCDQKFHLYCISQ